MRGIIARVDDALIDHVFQPALNRLNDHAPVGIFRAARVCVDLASLMWICAQASGVVARSHISGFSVIRFALIVMGLWAFSTLRGMFQRTDSTSTKGHANPLRAGMHQHRAVCLFWMIGLLIKTAAMPDGFEALALLAVGIFATSAVYIGACTKFPPKRRESWSWDLSRAATPTSI